jgi:hypothetical protein
MPNYRIMNVVTKEVANEVYGYEPHWAEELVRVTKQLSKARGDKAPDAWAAIEFSRTERRGRGRGSTGGGESPHA